MPRGSAKMPWHSLRRVMKMCDGLTVHELIEALLEVPNQNKKVASVHWLVPCPIFAINEREDCVEMVWRADLDIMNK